MDLLKAYNEVSAILDSLDFNSLFPGFHRYRFALYTSREICLEGRLMPYREEFRGNTCISYEGEFIAIWDMEMDPQEDMESLAYCTVHEMFHCCQNDNADNRYPDDLELLKYPDDLENYRKKYSENQYLADACCSGDIEAFKKFHAVRNQRLKAYPETVLQELKAETMEGLAEYVGMRALKTLNGDKFRAVVESYIEKLRAEDGLIFDVRRMSYYTGAIYFLCLEAFCGGVKCDFNGETAYGQNAGSFGGAAAELFESEPLAQNYAALQKQKSETVAAHMEKAEFVPCNGSICGYDPMNMFRIGDSVFCSHFICLRIDGEVKILQGAVALKMRDGSAKEIAGYYM